MKLIGIFFIVNLLACAAKAPTYIQGYIYNEERNPLKGIIVADPNDKTVFVSTNKQGYFRINHMINGKYLDLIFREKKIGSIYIVRTHPEKGMNYAFVEGRNDTVIINIKNYKIISQ